VAVEHEASAAPGALEGSNGLKSPWLYLLQLDAVTPLSKEAGQEHCDRCLFGLEARNFYQLTGQGDDSLLVHPAHDLLDGCPVHVASLASKFEFLAEGTLEF
jgi:hypothetical protein